MPVIEFYNVQDFGQIDASGSYVRNEAPRVDFLRKRLTQVDGMFICEVCDLELIRQVAVGYEVYTSRYQNRNPPYFHMIVFISTKDGVGIEERRNCVRITDLLNGSTTIAPDLKSLGMRDTTPDPTERWLHIRYAVDMSIVGVHLPSGFGKPDDEQREHVEEQRMDTVKKISRALCRHCHHLKIHGQPFPTNTRYAVMGDFNSAFQHTDWHRQNWITQLASYMTDTIDETACGQPHASDRILVHGLQVVRPSFNSSTGKCDDTLHGYVRAKHISDHNGLRLQFHDALTNVGRFLLPWTPANPWPPTIGGGRTMGGGPKKRPIVKGENSTNKKPKGILKY